VGRNAGIGSYNLISALGIDPIQRAFAPNPVQRQINQGKHTVNELIPRSVPRGSQVVVEDAAHAWIAMDRPDVVLHAIDDLLGAATGWISGMSRAASRPPSAQGRKGAVKLRVRASRYPMAQSAMIGNTS
jgi:hypothetical protein